jgi:hypothetical protein
MSDQSFQNEAEQLNAYLQRQQRAKVEGSNRIVMDFGGGPEDASKYLSMRHPGLTPMKMYSDPYCVLKDGEAKRAAWKGVVGGEFVWRYPNGDRARHTKQGVHAGYLRPVFIDEIDQDSRYAIFDEYAFDTSDGKKRAVSYEGLVLYRVSLEKSNEWFGTPIDLQKRDLTEMAYGSSRVLRSEGFGDVDPSQLARFAGTGAQVGSNMAIGQPSREDALNENYSGR